MKEFEQYKKDVHLFENEGDKYEELDKEPDIERTVHLTAEKYYSQPVHRLITVFKRQIVYDQELLECKRWFNQL